MDFMALRQAADTLLDADRRAQWAAAEAVLRQAGAAAYAELADIVAVDDGEAAVRAGALLGFDQLTQRAQDRVLRLRSPDPDDRRLAPFVLGDRGAEPLLPYARVLTTLLADPDPAVSQEAVRALATLGRATLPVLREVRRSSLPERRAALTALAEIGWDTIEPTDRRALTRLIAIKLASEVPVPVVPDGEWYAVRTSDRQAVLDAFGLSDPAPITLRAGFTLARASWHHPWSRRRGHQYGHEWCAQMFVTPVLDGWTLVFGTPVNDDDLAEHRSGQPDDEPSGYDHEANQRRCTELSFRLGCAVHWYATVKGDDWTAWCLADSGNLVRYYHHDFSEGEVQVGEPLPVEFHLRPHSTDPVFDLIDECAPPELASELRATAPRDSDDETYITWVNQVLARITEAGVDIPEQRDSTVIARHSSIDLKQLGPDTRTIGHGLLALTGCGRIDGHSGAFPL